MSRASGTDVVINAQQLARAPNANSLPDILAQLPTAARGSDGQIHMNGDHNGLNYVVDGVQIPEGLNRVLGNEIDPANIGFAEILEGAVSGAVRRQVCRRRQHRDQVTNRAGRSFSFDTRNGSYGLSSTGLSATTP